MSSEDKKKAGTHDESPPTEADPKPAGKEEEATPILELNVVCKKKTAPTDEEEEAIPILELNVASKKGTTPSDLAGSLKIPLIRDIENIPDLLLCLSPNQVAGSGAIVDYVKQWIQPKWKVYVSLSLDHVPVDTKVKEKPCKGYVCVNALLSFDNYAIDEDVVKNDTERKKIKGVLNAREKANAKIADFSKKNYIKVARLLPFDNYTIDKDVVKNDTERKKIERVLKAREKANAVIADYLKKNYIKVARLLSADINPGEWLLPIKVGKASGGTPQLLAYVKVKIADEIDEPPKEPKKETAKA